MYMPALKSPSSVIIQPLIQIYSLPPFSLYCVWRGASGVITCTPLSPRFNSADRPTGSATSASRGVAVHLHFRFIDSYLLTYSWFVAEDLHASSSLPVKSQAVVTFAVLPLMGVSILIGEKRCQCEGPRH